MTKYEFTITIGASAVNVAQAAITAGAVIKGYGALYSNTYLPAAKLSFQMQHGGSGLGFVGPSTVTSAGANASYELAAATASAPGAFAAIESSPVANTIDLAQYWVHGANPGDKILVSYEQA